MRTWNVHMPWQRWLTNSPYLNADTDYIDWVMAEYVVIDMCTNEFLPRVSRKIWRKDVRRTRRARREHEKAQVWTPFYSAVRDELVMRSKDW